VTGTVTEGTLWRQVAALFRMEMLLLRRNMTSAVLVVLLPLLIGTARIGGSDVGADPSAGVDRIASAFGLIAVIFVHHHLVTVYATRRQELVLKRLRAGLPSDWTIIWGAATGALVIFVVQAAMLAAYGVLVLRLPVPKNPISILLALLVVGALMATVSAVMSAVTRSAEAAMLTTFPTMALFLLTPGVLVPYGALPATVERAAWFSPLGPFGEVIRVGWLGIDGESGFVSSLVGSLPGLAMMFAWLALTMLMVQRWFRWEPRTQRA
jgi:ABC-2 type transport system permease protein